MTKEKIKSNRSTASSSMNWIFLSITSIVFFIIYQFIFDQKLDSGGDNAMYYILGKSINTGEGYKNIHFLSNANHSHFPPGYPTILGLMMFLSNSITFLKIINGLFLFGTVLLAHRIFLKFSLDPKLAFVAALVVLFNSNLLHYSTIIMSESSFTFFTVLSLFLFIKISKKDVFWKSPTFYFLILTSAFAFHIRTQGIALIAGIVLFLLIKKNWKLLGGYIIGFGLSVLPWMLRNKMVGAESSYTKSLFRVNPYRADEGMMQFSDWITRFFINLSRYVTKEIPNALFPGIEVDYTADSTATQWIIGIMIISIVIYGLFQLKNYKILMLGYLLGTFGILLLWPDVWYGIRFALPTIPFLLFFFILGLIKLIEFGLQKVAKGATVTPYLALVLIFLFLPQVKELNALAKKNYPTQFYNYFEIGNYVNTNLPEDAVISTRKPAFFYLFANRKVQRFPYEKDYNKFLNSIDTSGVTHVVLEQLGYPQTWQYLGPVVQANNEKFKNLKVLANPDTYLLSFDNSAGYNGEWKQQKDARGNPAISIREGQGTYTYGNGAYYEGSFVNNFPEGKGVLKNKNGQITQQGYWSKGQYLGNNESETND